MGSIHSIQALEQCTANEIAHLVSEFGEKYHKYSEPIRNNCIDGRFLASLTADSLAETLDRLKVTERLHRRKLERALTKIVSLSPELDSVSQTEDSTASPISSHNSCSSLRSSHSSLGSSQGHKRRTSEIDVSTIMECVLVANELDNKQSESSGMHLPAMLDAIIEVQKLERKSLQENVLALETERTLDSPPEEGLVAIVLTDVEGSTNLWETNPEAMKEALSLHDSIIRKLREENHGYEIDTEGDAFFLAFSEPCDALAFAIKLQVALNEASWSDEILATQWAGDDGVRRGLRVRVSIHMGPVETMKNPVTRRTDYFGEAMDVAEELENFTRGGQILTTADTWNAAFHLADAKLGSPHVSEFHKPLVLSEKGMVDVVSQPRSQQKRVIEITPRTLKRLTTATVKRGLTRQEHFVRNRSTMVHTHRLKSLGAAHPATTMVRA